jgi:hypothetical protein
VANLPGRTAARVAILAQALLAGGARQAGDPDAGIVATACGVAQLIGRTGIHRAGPQQAGSTPAIAVGRARHLELLAARHTLAVQANRGRATIGIVVDSSVTVVVLAIADLEGWPDAARADPAGHARAVKVPRLAFALQGSARRQTGRIAVLRRRSNAFVHAPVAVVVLPVAHLRRGPDIVADDVPAHAFADTLPAFAHCAATGDANPGHAVVRLVDLLVTVVVDPVADLGRRSERTDRTLDVLPQGVADVLARPLARPFVARQPQVGKVLVHSAIAVVVFAVA